MCPRLRKFLSFIDTQIDKWIDGYIDKVDTFTDTQLHGKGSKVFALSGCSLPGDTCGVEYTLGSYSHTRRGSDEVHRAHKCKSTRVALC